MKRVGIIIVELCESNMLQTLDPEEVLESEYPEVSVIVNECLSLCGLCRSSPFAFVNGERIRGRDAEHCLSRIRQAIDEELAKLQ